MTVVHPQKLESPYLKITCNFLQPPVRLSLDGYALGKLSVVYGPQVFLPKIILFLPLLTYILFVF